MATKEQLRKLRQKYHLGEYKKHHSRKIYKHKRSNYSMARKRRVSHRRGGGFNSTGVWGQLLGVGVYVLFENYAEPLIPLSEPILSIAELGVSYWMSKKSGIVGNIGKAGVYVNMYQLMKYMAGKLPSIGGIGQRSTVTDMFAY